MNRNFQKEYIELSNEFRKSQASEESVSKLYDFLEDLNTAERTTNENLILSNVYNLLGFHQSAYEIFSQTADLNNIKNKSKLYVMKEKARTHGDNFIIKDMRKLRVKNKPTRLSISDFYPLEEDYNSSTNNFQIKKDVVIFNKVIKSEEVHIEIHKNYTFDDYVDKIIDYIFGLSDCKKELITFYNQNMRPDWQKVADENWFYSLDIFRATIIVGLNGNLYAEITGEDLEQDHLLDIEMENYKVTSMGYDG